MWKRGFIVAFLSLGVCSIFVAQNSDNRGARNNSLIDPQFLDSLLERTSKLYDEARYEEQIAEADKGIALTIKKDSFYLAAFENQKANAFYGQENYSKAISGYNRAISNTPSDERGLNQRATLLFDRANAEYQLELMTDCYQSTLASEEILSRLENSDFDYLISVYVDLAYQSRKLDFYDDARKFLQKARQIYDENKEIVESYNLSLRQPVSFAYSEILINARDKDEKRMLEALESLNDLLIEKEGSNDELIRLSSAYVAVADFYINDLHSFDAEKFEKAKHFLALAKETATKNYKPQVAQIKFNEAKMYYNVGQYEKAEIQFEAVVSEIDKKDVRMPFFIVMQGLTAMKLKKLSESSKFFRSVLEFIHNSDERLSEDARNYVPGTNIIHATLFAEISDTIRKNDPKLYDEVGAQLKLAGMREFEANYQGKTFNNKLKATYESLFQGMLEPILENSDPLERTRLFAEVLNQSETIENRLLWSKFLLNRRMGQLKVPDSVRRDEQMLRLNIVEARRGDDSQRCFELEKELEKLERSILKKYPKYGEFSQSHFDVKKLQSELDEECLVVKYELINEQLYRFDIDHSTIQCTRLKASERLQTRIKSYLSVIFQRREDRQLASDLRQDLLPKNYSKYSKITIVNNLVLGELPFEALCDENHDYLVQSSLITYAPHLVFIHGEKNVSEGNGEVVVFYPSYKESQTSLLGAKEETKLISSRFNSNYFGENSATRKAFLDASSEASVLHLSMHAEINEDVGEQSCFLFNDDKLYLDELYGLNLSGQMAVLSACNTGRSFKDVRNGNASLQRAFMYAGIPSTLSSLWEIPDQSTQKIMTSFYENLGEGKTNGEAIQEAKRDFLSELEDPHLNAPYFWAGFVLSGQDQAIALENTIEASKKWMWIVISVFVLAITAFFWIRAKRKNQLSKVA